MYRVTLYDLSDYGDNTVFASDAPIYDVLYAPDAGAAFDLVMDYQEVFQTSMQEVPGL